MADLSAVSPVPAMEWMTGPQLWTATSEQNAHVLGFLSDRFAKDARMMRELAACRTWADLSQVQASWTQEAFRDWSEQATKLMALVFKPALSAAQVNLPQVRTSRSAQASA